MGDENKEKIVNFHEYCPTCKYSETKEQDEPCSECLDEPSNIDSHKPVFWEEK